MAPTGAVVNHSGSCALLAYARIRASGLRPRSEAVAALITTSAAAPSEIEEELAAVTVPSLLKAGFIVVILLTSQVPGVSSRATTVSPLRPFTVTGVTSTSNSPACSACIARRTDSVAKASCWARLKS